MTGYLAYRLSAKKSRHQEDEDTLSHYLELYMQMKNERDELQKENNKLRKKLNEKQN